MLKSITKNSRCILHLLIFKWFWAIYHDARLMNKNIMQIMCDFSFFLALFLLIFCFSKCNLREYANNDYQCLSSNLSTAQGFLNLISGIGIIGGEYRWKNQGCTSQALPQETLLNTISVFQKKMKNLPTSRTEGFLHFLIFCATKRVKICFLKKS